MEFSPDSNRTYLVGANAQGKTSILEAVCVALRLQSPRTSTLGDAIRFDSPGFSLDARVGESHLVVRYSTSERKILLDSKARTTTEDYLDVGRVAWFANTDLELIRGGGSGRRRFLDFLGVQCIPGYRKALRAYEVALRSRNTLLKDNRPRREIEAFDLPLLDHGAAVLTARARLCTDIAPLAAQSCREISGDADELRLDYSPGASGDFAQALKNSIPEEVRLRQTTVGPHRDDFRLQLCGRQASLFASEGQQRGIALALKLAQARHLHLVQNRAPILLLDDVFGELDPTRRNRLLAVLPAESQSLITTTALDWAADPSPHTVLRIEQGGISPQR